MALNVLHIKGGSSEREIFIMNMPWKYFKETVEAKTLGLDLDKDQLFNLSWLPDTSYPNSDPRPPWGCWASLAWGFFFVLLSCLRPSAADEDRSWTSGASRKDIILIQCPLLAPLSCWSIQLGRLDCCLKFRIVVILAVGRSAILGGNWLICLILLFL